MSTFTQERFEYTVESTLQGAARDLVEYPSDNFYKNWHASSLSQTRYIADMLGCEHIALGIAFWASAWFSHPEGETFGMTEEEKNTYWRNRYEQAS